MEMERNQYMKNTSHERNDDRSDYRNGYYERDLILSVGKVKLKVPRTRSGEFSTELFEKYKRCDKAFLLSMVEMVINGVSTRDRKSTRLNSSHVAISYAVFCLNKK